MNNTGINSTQNTTRIDVLESVRGIAALLVVLYHLPAWHPSIKNLPILHGGAFMVDLFFVLSGFVIYSAYHNRLKSIKDILRFQFLRLGRLYPVHLLMLLVYVLIEMFKYLMQTKFGIASVSNPPFSQNNLAAFFRELFLIKAFWPNQTAMAFNSPAWSISAEFYTYILFAVVTYVFNQIKLFVFFVLAITSILLLIVYQPDDYNFMLRCFAGFFSGCLVASFVIQQRQAENPVLPVATIPLACVLILSVTLIAEGFYGYGLVIYPATALLILGMTLTKDSVYRRAFAHPWLIWIGTVSYSLYMSHGAVLWVFNQFVRQTFHQPEVFVLGVSTPQFGLLAAVPLAIGYLIFCLGLAQIMYTLVEKPFRKKSRQLLKLE